MLLSYGGGNGSRPVGRVIVDDDQLPPASQLESRLRLAHQGGETGRQRKLFVSGGNNDGKLRSGISVVFVNTFGHKFVL